MQNLFGNYNFQPHFLQQFNYFGLQWRSNFQNHDPPTSTYKSRTEFCIAGQDSFALHGNLFGILGPIVEVQDQLVWPLGSSGASTAAGGVVRVAGHIAQGGCRHGIGQLSDQLLGCTGVQDYVIRGVGRLGPRLGLGFDFGGGGAVQELGAAGLDGQLASRLLAQLGILLGLGVAAAASAAS